MFGDDVSADIEGARQHLGCVTFLKQNQRSLRSLSACKPDVIFEDYMDIAEASGRPSFERWMILLKP